MPALVTSTLPDAITQKLSDYVAKHTPHTFPACDLVVLHRGEQVLQGAWGTCEGIAPQADRRWDIASLTKLFTTTCVLSLCSQGKLDLDSAVGDWLPAFVRQALRPVEPGQNPHTLARLPVPADRQGLVVDAREITLRQLLTHTSGLQDWRAIFLALAESAPAPRRGEGAAPNSVSRVQEAVEWIGQCGFQDAPGRSIVYSDLGFILLGEIASRCMGKPLAQCIADTVLAPLALSHTGFNPSPELPALLPTELDLRWRGRRVWGEVHDENACAMGGVSGHAGLFSNARDVAQLGLAWLQAPEGPLPVSPALAREAVQVQAENPTQRRGLGFMLKAPTQASCGDFFSPQSFGHTGYTGTSLWVDPQAQLVVACLSNAVYGGRDMKMQAFRQGLHDLIGSTLSNRSQD